MNVSKKITIDLNNPRKNVVHLGQGDNQHQIVLTLLKDGMPFDVSEGIGTATLVAGVHYIKANGIGGYYDWTSTDLAAVVLATGTTNVWNVLIDEHATDVPGFAEIFVTFSLASGETLHSFPITLDVIRTSGGTTDPDKPYYHSTSFLLAGAQAEKTASMTTPIGVDSNGKLWADTLMTLDAKDRLLNLLAHVAYIDQNGQDYYDALEIALRAKLSYIVADYVQDRTIYTDDSLDVLKESDDLIVTAYYDDGSHINLSDSQYTLSGTLTAGTSTITVTYGGKTTTFDVTVTAPLYSIPDFAAQTVTVSNKTMSVKKENGVYTMSGTADGAVYVYPNGTVNSAKSNTLWFSTLQDKPFVSRALDVQYANTGSVALTFSTKLGQSDNTGNLASTSLSIAANSSGTEAVVEFSNDAYNARNMSCLALQISGARSYSATVSFKVRMFCDGVRYL